MKRRMPRGGWLVALPFLVGPPAASAQAPPLVTLAEAHRLALDSYEVIGSGQERIEQAE